MHDDPEFTILSLFEYPCLIYHYFFTGLIRHPYIPHNDRHR